MTSLKRTYVIENVLSTDVHHSTGKVGVHHLHGIIKSPQSSAERITDTWETSAGSGVCLKHKQFLVLLLSVVARIDECLNNGLPS